MKKTPEHLLKTLVCRSCAVVLLLVSIGYGAEQKDFREEAQFEIRVAGKEIGREKFSIQGSGDSVRCSSALNYRPANSSQTVKMETELTTDGRFVPRSYQLRTDMNGQKGIMRGTFAAGQAAFEYLVPGANPRKTGLLVGEQYVVLDTNVFYHFVFIARLFDFSSKERTQSIEVVIPQEMRNGLLKVSDGGLEKTSVRGKNRELHHLKADSGSVQIDLWVDDQHVLYKIALPAKNIEVVRG